eukprot:7708931-Alexandrium_andersonii.AAC.1
MRGEGDEPPHVPRRHFACDLAPTISQGSGQCLHRGLAGKLAPREPTRRVASTAEPPKHSRGAD